MLFLFFMERHYKLKQQAIRNQIKMATYNKSGQSKAKAQFPDEDIYKLFATQAHAYSYHNYNMLYHTTEGCFYSTGENFVDILPYFIKYMKKGDVNTGGEPPKKYIERFNRNSKPQVGKIWFIYVDGRPNHKGQNRLYRVDETDFKKQLKSLKGCEQLQLLALIARMMNADILNGKK
jgi:hypothetical protein